MSTGVAAALLIVYVVWGTTYLAIRVAVQSLPPFLMAGTRFLVAGGTLFGILRWRGAPAPSRAQWRAAALVGTLMWVIGNGGLTFVEQSVPSGLSAVIVASVPLWAAVFAGFWGSWPRRTEWAGLALGSAGIIVLSRGDGFRASPGQCIFLLGAAASFALGSMWSHRLPASAGLMGSATTMLTSGAMLLLVSAAARERLVGPPSLKALLATTYLIVFGAMLAASAYGYLLQHARPTVATSYAFVNPVIAVLVGTAIAGERVSAVEIIALGLIVAAVAFVVGTPGHRQQRR